MFFTQIKRFKLKFNSAGPEQFGVVWLQSLVGSWGQVGCRERLIGVDLNPTMAFYGLKAAAELIFVVVQSTNSTR